MYDLLLSHQDELQPKDLVRYAEQLGLDVEEFTDALSQRAGAARVAEDVDSADLSGVSGTPTFFINGRRHYGAYDIETLSSAVQAARARASLAPTPREELHDDMTPISRRSIEGTALALDDRSRRRSATTAVAAQTDSTPVGPLPAGPASTIATQRGELIAVALPHRTAGRVWRIARTFDTRVIRQVGEADVGTAVVLTFKATGKGTATLRFGLTKGETAKAFESRRVTVTVR